MLVYLGSVMTMVTAFSFMPAYGQDEVEQESTPPMVSVCPDGRYESGCSITEMERAIVLTPDAIMLLSKQCLYATKARCWVNSSGTISSMERGGPVVWQHLLLSPKDGPAGQMIILVELDGKPVPTLVAAQQTEGYFSPPDVVQNSDDGVLIHVPGITGGTGGGNADVLVMRTKQGWNVVNLELWFDDVNVMLPTGFEIRKGVDLNLREMIGFSPVWREDDGNCCGTGGTVIIDFEVADDNRLAVARLTFDETKPVGQTQYILEKTNSADAETPEAYAVQANMAFQTGADSGLSPMTASEMAVCKTLWDRWKYFVDSSNVPAFNNSLRTELSSKSAKKTSANWLQESKKTFRSYGDGIEGFSAILAEADEQADVEYSRLMRNDPETSISFPKTLGNCRLVK